MVNGKRAGQTAFSSHIKYETGLGALLQTPTHVSISEIYTIYVHTPDTCSAKSGRLETIRRPFGVPITDNDNNDSESGGRCQAAYSFDSWPEYACYSTIPSTRYYYTTRANFSIINSSSLSVAEWRNVRAANLVACLPTETAKVRYIKDAHACSATQRRHRHTHNMSRF